MAGRRAQLVGAGALLAARCVAAAIVEPATSEPGGRRSDGPWTVGCEFRVGGEPLTVNALGAEDINNANPAGFGDGLYPSGKHGVGIWDASGTLLCSVSVPDGRAAAFIKGFRYVRVPPLTLSTGSLYTIAATVGGNVDYFSDGQTPPNYRAGAGATLVRNVYNTTVTAPPTWPTADGKGTLGRWACGNATFVRPVAAGIPMLLEPATTNYRTNYTGTVGYEFTTGPAAVRVCALGFFDSGLDGLSSAHRIGVWDGGDTNALVAEASVFQGTGSTLIDAYRYQLLDAELVLSANHTYWIGAETFSSGDAWPNVPDSSLPGFTAPPFAGYRLTGTGVFLKTTFGTPVSRDPVQIFAAPNLLTVRPRGTVLLVR